MSRLQERDGSKVPPVTRLLTSGRPLVRPSNWPRTPGQDNTASFLAGHRAPHHDPAFAWTLRVSIAPALCCRATVAARVRVTPDRTPLRQINARADARGHRQPVSGGTPCVSPSSLPHWRRSGPACSHYRDGQSADGRTLHLRSGLRPRQLLRMGNASPLRTKPRARCGLSRSEPRPCASNSDHQCRSRKLN